MLSVLQDREFTGKVVEIINGDALMVKAGKAFKKIHLASIRSVKRCVIVLLMLIRNYVPEIEIDHSVGSERNEL